MDETLFHRPSRAGGRGGFDRRHVVAPRGGAVREFGVSSAIKWVKRHRADRQLSHPPDRRSQAAVDLGATSRCWLASDPGCDFTLRGWWPNSPSAGSKVDYRSVWEFRPCRGAELQKKACWPANSDRPDVARRRAQWTKYQDRIAPDAPGLHRRDLGQDQHGAAARLGAARPALRRQGPVRPLEDDDLPRRAAPRPHRCARGCLDRPINGEASGLCGRAAPGADAVAGRHRRPRQSRQSQGQSRAASRSASTGAQAALPAAT